MLGMIGTSRRQDDAEPGIKPEAQKEGEEFLILCTSVGLFILLSELLTSRLAWIVAARTSVAVLLDVNPNGETTIAPPPIFPWSSLGPPLFVIGDSPSGQVLFVKLAHVVAIMVYPEEGGRVSGALSIIAQELLLLGIVNVNHLVVTVQICHPPKRALVAPCLEAGVLDRIET